jgi:hypothetical protein
MKYYSLLLICCMNLVANPTLEHVKSSFQEVTSYFENSEIPTKVELHPESLKGVFKEKFEQVVLLQFMPNCGLYQICADKSRFKSFDQIVQCAKLYGYRIEHIDRQRVLWRFNSRPEIDEFCMELFNSRVKSDIGEQLRVDAQYFIIRFCRAERDG